MDFSPCLNGREIRKESLGEPVKVNEVHKNSRQKGVGNESGKDAFAVLEYLNPFRPTCVGSKLIRLVPIELEHVRRIYQLHRAFNNYDNFIAWHKHESHGMKTPTKPIDFEGKKAQQKQEKKPSEKQARTLCTQQTHHKH